MKTSDYYNILNSFSFQETARTCDLCGRRISEDSYAISSGMELCPACLFRWEEIGSGHTRDCILNFSMGNVC